MVGGEAEAEAADLCGMPRGEVVVPSSGPGLCHHDCRVAGHHAPPSSAPAVELAAQPPLGEPRLSLDVYLLQRLGVVHPREEEMRLKWMC